MQASRGAMTALRLARLGGVAIFAGDRIEGGWPTAFAARLMRWAIWPTGSGMVAVIRRRRR